MMFLSPKMIMKCFHVLLKRPQVSLSFAQLFLKKHQIKVSYTDLSTSSAYDSNKFLVGKSLEISGNNAVQVEKLESPQENEIVQNSNQPTFSPTKDSHAHRSALKIPFLKKVLDENFGRVEISENIGVVRSKLENIQEYGHDQRPQFKYEKGSHKEVHTLTITELKKLLVEKGLLVSGNKSASWQDLQRHGGLKLLKILPI